MPDYDDPFFSSENNDRTVIRPIPGGRRQDIPRPDQFSTHYTNDEIISLERLGKINPLESAASALLALIAKLYHKPHHSNPRQLKQQLVQAIRTFQLNSEKAGYDNTTTNEASYALCTTVDEAIMHTPWGRDSGWGEQPLLSLFHQDVSGGEKFFGRLKALGQNPAKNIDLLELLYICLALGYQGRYAVVENGKEKLAGIRQWLADLIRKQRGTTEPNLSPHWQGITVKKKNLMHTVPIWVYLAIASLLLLGIFMAFLFSLNAHAKPIKKDIALLSLPDSPKITAAPAKPKIDELTTLRKLLSDEIRREWVDVRDKNGKTLIELRGIRGLFRSGSDQVLNKRQAVIAKISDILVSDTFAHHSLSVVGHTDNQPIRNPIRFADNYELSRARANSVTNLLTEKNPTIKNRLTSEGKADLDPIDNADNANARRKNRRVEIILE
jgi:type VI secretion system protein ImpK